MMENTKPLDDAWQLYASENYQEAFKRYNEFVSNNQFLPDSLICLGYCYDALGQKDEAFKCYQKAVETAPDNPNANSAVAGAYYERDLFQEAKKYSEIAINQDSKCVMALVNMGNILDVQKRCEEAISYYQKAIEANPTYSDAYSNMASVLFSMEKYKESLEAAKKAISITPNDANAYINIGNALDALGESSASVDYYQKALEFDENNMIVYNNLAGVYEKIDEFEKSGECYFKILEHNPEDHGNHLAFGYLLYSMTAKNLIPKAQEYARKWQKMFPENSIAKHMSAAIAIGKVPDKASDDYVKKLFDAFAPDFDTSLNAIEYKAPKLIGKELAKNNKNNSQGFKILDAGCGTGLCGKYLKEYASKGLIGIDLSKGMLEQAKEKHIYDELLETEIVDFLKQHKDEFDIIVSADVFTYFGDLDELFKGLSESLKKGGQLFFTITRRLKPSPKGYILNASGRYSHNLDYVLKTLKNNSITVENFDEQELRKEAGESVMGFVISASKK